MTSSRLLLAMALLLGTDFAQGQSSQAQSTPVWDKVAPPEPNRSEAAPLRPVFNYPFLRQDEDWSFLSDRSKRSDLWDPVKYVRLPCESCYFSLGGEQRAVYEWYDHAYWGAGPQTNDGFVTQRFLVTTDFHLGPTFRFFGELSSNLESGRRGGPRPYDQDRADVHQGFFEYKSPITKKDTLTVRAGRQEIFYGSGRLVDSREGLNKRFAWDGALVRWSHENWRVDGFAFRPVLLNEGVFDDQPDHATAFWGVYASGALTRVQNLDVYYLGLDSKSALFDKGAARQVRHTFGGRWWGTAEMWDYDDEVIGQLGTFGNGNIRAWGVATDHGYKLNHLRRNPRIGLRADANSGDDNRRGRDLGTFSPLFPKGKYFGEADLNGPSNTLDVLPNFAFDVTRKIRATALYGAFWRESIHDGLYGFASNLLIPGTVSRERFEGQQAEIDFDFPVNQHWLLRTAYQHFFPGPFIRAAAHGKEVNYVTLWWVYRF